MGRRPRRRDAGAHRPGHELGLVASCASGRDPTAVAVGEGAVWVAGGEDGHRGPDRPRRAARGRAAQDREQPVGARGRRAARCGPPRSRPSRRTGAERCGSDLPLRPDTRCRRTGSTRTATSPYTWMLAGLAYDGLVAYRRVSGVAGATLVGGLATRPPTPSPDGRTYVFTLRRGIRYSDGTPVRPGDFRASMERYLGAPSYATFPPYFTGIVGARRCISERGAVRPLARHRVGCARADDHRPPDRARPGVPAQADAPFAYVVPSGTPARTRMTGPSRRPAPARIASPAGTSRRGGVLVRNPRFRPTAARPAGFPDRIEIKVTPAGTPRDAHRGGRARQRGSDVARGLPPARASPGPRRARARPAAQQPRGPGPRGCS